jgi:ABC-type bacteriocin/lantibiotic exporter with double-glycine peptidase domain
MIAKYYGKAYSLERFRELTATNRNGVTMLGISDAAEDIGFRTTGFRIGFEKLVQKVVLPCIVHWRHDHFIVIYKIKVRKKGDSCRGKIYVADPAFGLIQYDVAEFLDGWLSAKERGVEKGMVLMLAPSIRFFRYQEDGRYYATYRRSQTDQNFFDGNVLICSFFFFQLFYFCRYTSILQFFYSRHFSAGTRIVCGLGHAVSESQEKTGL